MTLLVYKYYNCYLFIERVVVKCHPAVYFDIHVNTIGEIFPLQNPKT